MLERTKGLVAPAVLFGDARVEGALTEHVGVSVEEAVEALHGEIRHADGVVAGEQKRDPQSPAAGRRPVNVRLVGEDVSAKELQDASRALWSRAVAFTTGGNIPESAVVRQP